MNTQITIDKLEQMKLYGMSRAYQAILSMPVQDQPSLSQFMARLAEAEALDRSHKKTEKYLMQSKLRYNAVLEQVQCNASRNLTQEKLMMVVDCSFIDRAENILITGATGCGKSYLACAIGRQACTFGYRTLYFGINRFLEKIACAKLDGSFVKLLNQIEKTHLIILDDFGMHPLDGTARLAILQILEDRYGKKSMIITSQLPVAKWYEYIGESTFADAIMDRLSVHAHRFELKGESLRKKK
jgi:DNA replication protein DnaC